MGLWQSRYGNNILRRRASFASPPNFFILFCQQKAELEHGCVASTKKQIFGQFCGFNHGGRGQSSPFELWCKFWFCHVIAILALSLDEFTHHQAEHSLAVTCIKWEVPTDRSLTEFTSHQAEYSLAVTCNNLKVPTMLITNHHGKAFLTHCVPFPPAGEVYKISFPAYYVRGILIGVMRMEIRWLKLLRFFNFHPLNLRLYWQRWCGCIVWASKHFFPAFLSFDLVAVSWSEN